MYAYVRAPEYFPWVYMHSLVNLVLSLFVYMRALVRYVYAYCVPFGIHEKVHELCPATTPLDQQIGIYSVTLACPSLPSWGVTSAPGNTVLFFSPLSCPCVKPLEFYADVVVTVSFKNMYRSELNDETFPKWTRLDAFWIVSVNIDTLTTIQWFFIITYLKSVNEYRIVCINFVLFFFFYLVQLWRVTFNYALELCCCWTSIKSKNIFPPLNWSCELLTLVLS